MAGGGPSGPQINVTPLIDVLLTLIVMFMLVVAMDPEYVEKVQIPQPSKDPSSERANESAVVIQVVWTPKDASPSVKINQEDVRWEDLELRLAQIYLKRAEKVALVRGDADVDFLYVADVIDLAHHAGVQRVGLMTNGQQMAGE
jgi:biopolymer transport protein ExbD